MNIAVYSRCVFGLQPIFTVSSQDQLIRLLTVDEMQHIKDRYAGNPVCHLLTLLGHITCTQCIDAACCYISQTNMGLIFDSFRKFLKTHLFGDRSA